MASRRSSGVGGGKSREVFWNDNSGDQGGNSAGRGSTQRTVSLRGKSEPSGPLTPYRAVCSLAEQGVPIEMETGRRTRAEWGNGRKWRCEVTYKDVNGICESNRKTVAREMACSELLTKLDKGKLKLAGVRVPNHYVPKELFIDPRLFFVVTNIARREGMRDQEELCVKQIKGKKGGDRFLYVFNLYIGNYVFSGEHSDIEYAKARATKAAYESLSGRPYRGTTYFTGEQCLTDFEYATTEREKLGLVLDTSKVNKKKIPQDKVKKTLHILADGEGTRKVLAVTSAESLAPYLGNWRNEKAIGGITDMLQKKRRPMEAAAVDELKKRKILEEVDIENEEVEWEEEENPEQLVIQVSVDPAQSQSRNQVSVDSGPGPSSSLASFPVPGSVIPTERGPSVISTKGIYRQRSFSYEDYVIFD